MRTLFRAATTLRSKDADDICRGMFAGEVGVPRMVELFRRYGLTQTFFWPGHSIETFPKQFDNCVTAGHEIGVHGYSHENPTR